MDSVFDYNILGAKTWGFIFFVLFWVIACLVRRVAACCLSSQRTKLRDEYEEELRKGGKLTNRLLLPAVGSNQWNCSRLPV